MTTATPTLITAVCSRLHHITGPDDENWYTALCPFHPDRHHPNLRVCASGFRCMACGAKGNLHTLGAKLGLEPLSGSLTARIEATYDYRDAGGRLVFQVVRLRDPKDFRQRQPDGKGGWVWNLRGITPVLYRLPELIAADPAQPVFIVEGEKDVDALLALGLIATCNPGGAGKWRSDYNAWLRGRQVVILPDNDAVGVAHAEEVAQCLMG